MVWIPALLRDLTGGQEIIESAGQTVGAIIDDLERRFPGARGRLCQDDGLKPGIAVVVGSAVARRGLEEAVARDDEMHFVRAIAGGSA